MGIPAEPKVMRARQGIAMAAALFGIVLVGLLTAGVFTITNRETATTRTREDAALAMRIAQTGMTHGLSILRNQARDTSLTRLLRGWDNNSANVADNGLFINYPGLTSANNIPATGVATTGGTYYVQILNDESEAASPFTDNNWRVLLRCTGVTATGGRAVVDATIRYLPPLPGIAFNGNVTIQGTGQATGACGNIHANGNMHVTGNIGVTSTATLTGTQTGGGNIINASGVNVGTTQIPVPIPIPPMSSADQCTSAQYTLQANGNIMNRATGVQTPATGSFVQGWRRVSTTPTVWESNSSLLSGTYCVEGNVNVTGAPGTTLSPVPVGIYASGSVNVSGTPNLQSYTPNAVVLLADGDLWVRGNAGTSYHGIVYGGSNCQVSGNPYLTGQYLCQSGPLPAGAQEIVAVNLVEGGPTFNYACQFVVENDRYRITSWYQRFGM